MTLCFFLIYHISSGCSDLPKILDQFICWAERLKPITNDIRTDFMSCIINCNLTLNENKLDCTKECMKYANPSEISENCILSCSSVKDPINQDQCLNNCRQTKRLQPNEDFGDAYDRCRNFHNFLIKVKPEKQPLKETLETICSSFLSTLPICHAIAKITFDQMYLHFLQFIDGDSFCKRIGLIPIE